MHDPMTVALEIRRPWPQRSGGPVKQPPSLIPRGLIYRRGDGSWGTSCFMEWRGQRWYWPPLITVWHVDPEKGGDDDSCRRAWKQRFGFKRSFWVYKLHVHHWSIQVHPAQALRRWLLTRCAGCGKRFAYGYAPVSFQWDKPKRSFWQRWTRGEEGLFHHDEHHAAGEPPCSLLHERESYLRWREAYPSLVDGEFDRGDPVDNWLDRESMKKDLANG